MPAKADAMPETTVGKVTLADLRELKRAGRKFAMLTAYDYILAVLAQRAGVHSLLIGDSMGCVVLGQENTQSVPLELMLTLGRAVRRGAPDVYLIGDIPYQAAAAGADAVLDAARRFRDEVGCDAVKMEVTRGDAAVIEKLAAESIETIAHLGLRPQSVTRPEEYRAQARDEPAMRELAGDAQRMEACGAAMILLEAVPPQAARAVLDAVRVPVVGCGAGPECDGHVVVTHDMLGLATTRPPRFVPVLANVAGMIEEAMRAYVAQIAAGVYPRPEHAYSMRRGAS